MVCPMNTMKFFTCQRDLTKHSHLFLDVVALNYFFVRVCFPFHDHGMPWFAP